MSRGKGQMVVNSAAYISGQKLYNDYYGLTHDYTKKSGVIFTEILTPAYAPERMSDRETLWNEVERTEKGKREKGHLLIDEETAPIVRKIFHWAVDGHGINFISRELERQTEQRIIAALLKRSQRKFISI